MSDQEGQIVISIEPTPSPEEMAAITAAVTAALRAAASTAGLPPPEPSRWSHQGRLDAMLGVSELDDGEWRFS